MISRKLHLFFLGAALAAGMMPSAMPAPAQAQLNQTTTLVLRNAAFDSLTVEVVTGPNQAQAVPYGKEVLQKDKSWSITSNMPIFWRRELNPGSNDGKFTDWQRVYSGGEVKVDITA